MEGEGIPKDEIKGWLHDYEESIALVKEEVWTRKDHDKDMVGLHMGTHEKGEEKTYKPVMWFDKDDKVAHKPVGKGHYLRGANAQDGRFIKDAFGIAYSVVSWLSEYGDVDIKIYAKQSIIRERIEGQPKILLGTEMETKLSTFALCEPAQIVKDYEHQHFVSVDKIDVVNAPQSTLEDYNITQEENI